MLFHGYHKLINGIDGIMGLLNDIGLPGFLAYAVFLGELIAPVLLIIGYRARLASLFIATTMIVAIFLAHSDEIFKIGTHGNWAIEINGLYLLGSIAIIFLGGGKLGLSSSNKWD